MAATDMSTQDYLRRILTARVYDVAEETPLEEAKRLSKRIGNKVLLKREDTQPVFSFKLRGAFNKMIHLTAEERARGVICASAGNHAQGVALAARRLGCRAVIVMPVTAPNLKVEAVRNLGGEVVLVGDSFSDAAAHAVKMQQEEGLTFVHPFDDPFVIAGQGTIGMEILRQYQPADGSRPDAIFVQIGGGGLAAGVATYIKALYPDIKVFGVETKDSDAMKQAFAAGHPVMLSDVGLFSDGTAVKQVGTKPTGSAGKISMTSSSLTAMKSVPPSRMSLKTRAALWSLRGRCRLPDLKPGSAATTSATKRWWRLPRAPI